MPAPIPAFAPLERPLLPAELVDVLSVEGRLTDEKPGMFVILFCLLKEKLCPNCGAVMFELIDRRLFGLTFRCQSVPFAAFVR